MQWNGQNGEALWLRAQCTHFSRLGWALFAQMGLSLGLSVVVVLVAATLRGDLLESTLFVWLSSVLCTYGIGCAAFCVIIRPAPAQPTGVRRALGLGRFLQTYCISMAVLYLSNSVTLMLTEVIGRLRGAPITNPVESILDTPLVLSLILTCVIAPVLEEIMFRGLLFSRLRPFGERFAVLASALCFGLFHGNLSQFFYAFGIGVVFAYVVAKTGCLWQTMLLHAMLNFTSAGLIPLLGRFGEQGNLILSALVLVLMLLGIVFFLSLRRDLTLERGGGTLTEGQKWRLFVESPGVAVFGLLALCSAGAMLFA